VRLARRFFLLLATTFPSTSKMDESNSPYILQPLLFPALPNLDSINPTSPAATARAVRSIEGSVNHLYLGSSDGQVHVYSLSNQGSSTDVSIICSREALQSNSMAPSHSSSNSSSPPAESIFAASHPFHLVV